VGNALRRALLSSIEGAAITAVKIEGVLHEFSPIPGVVEDATDIILNLKQIPFKIMGDGIKTVRLTIDQQGDVRSGQIETDADGGDGCALNRAEQDAAQAVADGCAEAALKRLGGKHSIPFREGFGIGY
jgi:hypothetical protein